MSHRHLFVIGLVVVSSVAASAQSSLPPSWIYSSYFGGAQFDSISAMTRDSAGDVYVAGITTSPEFPTTPSVYEPTFPGPWNYSVIFVSKFSADGGLVWSTFLGPGCSDYVSPTSIVVDSVEDVYVSGITECFGFPTTPGLPNYGNVFLSKLSPDGSQLLYSTVMGNNAVQGTPSVVIDSAGEAFVSGSGENSCCNNATGIIGPLGGIDDFWVAEINSAGTALKWSVVMGGTGDDESYGMAIDSADKLYVVGYSGSSDFPVTPGALDQPNGGRTFVAKFDPTKKAANSLVYSALIGDPNNGGNSFIQPFSIALDASKNAYVSTWTYNSGMYASPHAFQPTAPAAPSGYVFEVNAAASAIVNGTYVGGSGDDFATSVSVDNDGNTYLSGFTASWDFPATAYGYVVPNFTVSQGFYVKLNPQFAAISAVKFGSADETEAREEVPDMAQGLWVAGFTGSQFDTTANAYQPQYGGKFDGFLLHTDFAGLCQAASVAICGIAADANNSERIHLTAQAGDVEEADSIRLSVDGLSLYNVNAAQFDTWLPIAPGDHLAKVSVVLANGQSSSAQQSFTVASSSTCPMNPQSPSVTFCSPLNAAAVQGAVNVVVQSSDTTASGPLALFVDGAYVATLQSQSGTYTYTLNLATGAHRLGVSGFDSGNLPVRTTSVFTVQ